MALSTTTTKRNDVRTMIDDFEAWDKESWENFNNEIKYCEKHIILPDIPEDQVKQKSTEIIKAHGITKGNVTEGHREIIEKELIHWILNQIDTLNEELKQNYNQYDGYQCVCGNCTCNYNFMLDREFDFISFVNEIEGKMNN